MLVNSIAHLNRDFLVGSLEKRGKLWKWVAVYKVRKSMKLMCKTFDQHCEIDSLVGPSFSIVGSLLLG